MKKSPDDPIQFKIVSIEVGQFAYFENHYNPQNENLSIKLDLNFGLHFEHKVITLIVNHQFFQDDNMVLILEVACSFKLKEEQWDNCIIDNKIKFPKLFLTHLLVLTVGTSRGILHERKPTDFANLILPTMDVTKVIKKDLVVDVKESIEQEKK